MKWVKLSAFLMLALAIDGFQFLLSLALMVMGAFPGTIGGCIAGQQVAGDIGCVAAGLVGSIPFVNGILVAAFAPIGVGLGFAVSICISFTFGSALVLFLQISGMLDKKAAVAVYIGEAIPGFSVLPAWTALVIRCATKQITGDVVGKVITGAAAGVASTIILPNTPVGNAIEARTLRSMRTIVNAQPTYSRARSEEPRTPAMQDVRIPTRQVNEPYAQAA